MLKAKSERDTFGSDRRERNVQKSATTEYQHEGYACEGFAVWDDAGAKRPGILVFPEWAGVGEYTQKRAQMLGELGFNAFVVDVYGKGIRPNTPETCQTEMMKYATNRPLLRQRARCGLDQLRKVPNTDLAGWPRSATASAAWPCWRWCATDRTTLLASSASMACWRLRAPLKPDTYKGKILVLHGVDDPVVPDEQTMAFWKEMRDAKANWEFVAYGNALHTFTNWLMPEDGPPPAVYNKQADERSWIAMQDFFKEIFNRPPAKIGPQGCRPSLRITH